MVSNSALLQKIEQIRSLVQTAGMERALLFAEIEKGQVLEREIIEVKVTAETETRFYETGEPASEQAPASDGGGQPAQRPQELERRVRGVVNEIAPIAVFNRPAPGEDGGHAGRTIPKDRGQATALWRNVSKQWVLFDDFPSASVDEDK